MARTDDPRDVRGVNVGGPIRGPWLSGAAKGLDDERRKPPNLPRLVPRQSFEAVIATQVGDGEYTFTAQHLPTWDSVTPEIDWLTPESGNFHPITGTCYEANGNDAVDVGTVIHVREIRGLDGLPFYAFFRAVTAAAWTAFAAKTTISTGSPAGDVYRGQDAGGAMTDERRVFYAFELDGGDTVATTLTDAWVRMTTGGLLSLVTARTPTWVSVNAELVLYKVTTQYTPATLAWGAEPTTVRLGEWHEHFGNVMLNNTSSGRASDLIFELGGQSSIHGLALRMEMGSTGAVDHSQFDGTSILEYLDAVPAAP